MPESTHESSPAGDSRVRRSAASIAIVVGSTRPGRISLDVALWARDVLTAGSALRYEIVDLANVDLPLLDEPLPAAFGHYSHEHTRRWSATVAGFDGFLFVYPQYNWGYPAVLKNALDYLYAEWHGKPASLLTWSITGGARGAAQLLQVLHGLHMRPLDLRVQAALSEEDVDASRRLIDPERTFGSARPVLRAIDERFGELLRPATNANRVTREGA